MRDDAIGNLDVEVRTVERTSATLADVSIALRARQHELIDGELERARRYASYAGMSDEDLEPAVTRTFFRFLAIVEDLPVTESLIETEGAIAVRRAEQGVLVDDVISVYRDCMTFLRDAFIECAATLRLPDVDVVAKLADLWNHADTFTRVLSDVWARAHSERTRLAERARVEFLQRVLLGTVRAGDVATLGSPLGVTEYASYWVFRARGDAGSLAALSRHIERTARQPGSVPLIGPIDGDLVGISTVQPTVIDAETLGVAGPARITELPHAFAEASRMLHVARRFGQTGVASARSLGIKVAVASESEIGHIFVDLYVTPVLASGAGGEAIIHTVKVHLDSDCRYERTAQVMFAHPNTVRNRLRRFEEITGVDFDDLQRRLEIWWAIQYWQLMEGQSDEHA